MSRPNKTQTSAGSSSRIGEIVSGLGGEVRPNEPMSRHTSMRIGGPADALVVPRDIEDLRRLVRGAFREKIPIFVLGGTNLIVRDGGIRGIVVKLSCFQEVTIRSSEMDAGSGISFPKLARVALKAGLSGLEFACGIPGTLGGAIVMNAGTREGEIAQVLVSVRAMDPEGNVRDHPRSGLTFAYRSSKLPPGIILGALIKLNPAPRGQIQKRMEESLRHRRMTQPLHLPNAGCIFKNPPGDSAGRIIDQLGLKGMRVGDAQVSERHANFIVNRGQASASEVLALVGKIRERVRKEHGIELHLEVSVVGEES